MDISLYCRVCQTDLHFTNKCLLRMHGLSHLEDTGEPTLDLEDVDIRPLAASNLLLVASDLRARDTDLLTQYRRTAKELVPRHRAQCLECMTSLDGGRELELHLLNPGSRQ